MDSIWQAQISTSKTDKRNKCYTEEPITSDKTGNTATKKGCCFLIQKEPHNLKEPKSEFCVFQIIQFFFM